MFLHLILSFEFVSKDLEPTVNNLLNWLVSIERMLRSKETVDIDADASTNELMQAQVFLGIYIQAERGPVNIAIAGVHVYCEEGLGRIPLISSVTVLEETV